MKKLLSILLSACVILSGAIITSSALEDSKIDSRELVVVSPQASPDEASELETVRGLLKDMPQYRKVIYLGSAGDYGIYYNIPPIVLSYPLINHYGNYTFSGSGQTAKWEPSDYGVFVYGKGRLYDIAEAYENKDIDFDSVVSTIRTYMAEHEDVWFTFSIYDYTPEASLDEVTEPLPTHPILTPYENFVIEMNNRYGDHFDNFIQVGELGKYVVYFSNPVNRAVCDWMWESTYGKYKFVVIGGQTGNYEPEDLGLFVFDRDNHTVYNLREAYDNKDIDFDALVSAIRTYAAEHKDVWFTFGIEDIDNQVTEPVTTEPVTTEPVPTETATRTVCPKAPEANTMIVMTKPKTVKAKSLKKGKVTVSAITVKYAKGKVSYKKHSGSKLLSVTKKGKITVKKWKKAKKGIYKIKVRVTAAGTPRFRKASKLVTVKIKIK